MTPEIDSFVDCVRQEAVKTTMSSRVAGSIRIKPLTCTAVDASQLEFDLEMDVDARVGDRCGR